MASGLSTGAESDFIVTYDGPALRNGQMEVRELAPALLALADLFTETNALVSPGEAPVSLHIRATGRGSFDVNLALTVAGTAVSLISANPATVLSNLKHLVLSPVGLFNVIKRLGNSTLVATEQLPNGLVRITLQDGSSFEAPSGALLAAQNLTVRQRAREVLNPLKEEGVDELRLYRDSVTETVIALGAEDLPAFEAGSETTTDTVIDESTSRMVLTVASPSFIKGNKWRLGDGEQVFYVDMADQDFLARVERNEVAFRKDDLLRCQVRLRQARTADGALRTERIVTKVIEHITGSAPPLFE